MAKKRGRAASTKPPAAAKKPVKRARRGSAEKEVPEVPESEVDDDAGKDEDLEEGSSSSTAKSSKDDAGEDEDEVEDEDEEDEEDEEDDEDDSEVEYEDEPLEPKILPSRSTRGRRFNQLVRLSNLDH